MAPPIEIPIYALFLVLLVLAMPTVLPIITGLVCTRRTSWVSPQFGFFAGLGAALVGSATLGGATFGRASITGDTTAPIMFFIGLAATVIIQNVAVVGVCLFVNRRLDQNWGIRRW